MLARSDQPRLHPLQPPHASGWLLGRWALGLVCLLLVGGVSQVQADDRIWSGIVLASSESTPKPAPEELQRFSRKIEKFFGYNQLELIGSATKELDDKCERWLVPSQHFWLCVKAKRPAGEQAYTMQISLFHDRRQLVETQAQLTPGMPLLIRGPMHARGQLLIVLQLRQ